MVYYIMENLFAFIVQTGIWVPTLLMAIITGYNALQSEGRLRRISALFSLFSLSIALCYISWSIRVAFFSADSTPAEWIFWWQSAYTTGVLSFVFLALWALTFMRPELLETKTWLALLLFIPWILTFASTFILTNPDNAVTVVYAFVNDIQPPLLLQLSSTAAVLIYSIIPIILFSRYLLAEENKGTTNWRKIFFIEIGLILFLMGTILDASKIQILADMTIIVSRSLTALGSIVMFFGLKLPKWFHVD